MARGSGNRALPNQIYFLNHFGTYHGPYMKKPTSLIQKFSEGSCELMTYRLNNNGDFIKEINE